MHRWLFALSFVAATAHAQSASGTIDPGMTQAQVISHLGKPATVRKYQGNTYLLYPNNCKTCGMQDLVVLAHDSVVDAVFRSPNRHYSGTSSSPEATKPNARSARNSALNVPTSGAAPADSTMTSTSHPPADSVSTPTSSPPADSTATSTSQPPKPPK